MSLASQATKACSITYSVFVLVWTQKYHTENLDKNIIIHASPLTSFDFIWVLFRTTKHTHYFPSVRGQSMEAPSPLDLDFKKRTDHAATAKWKKWWKPAWLQSKWWLCLPGALRMLRPCANAYINGEENKALWKTISSVILYGAMFPEKATKYVPGQTDILTTRNKTSIQLNLSIIHLKNSLRAYEIHDSVLNS